MLFLCKEYFWTNEFCFCKTYFWTEVVHSYWNWLKTLNTYWSISKFEIDRFEFLNCDEQPFPECINLPQKIDHFCSNNYQSMYIYKCKDYIFFEIFCTYYFCLLSCLYWLLYLCLCDLFDSFDYIWIIQWTMLMIEICFI